MSNLFQSFFGGRTNQENNNTRRRGSSNRQAGMDPPGRTFPPAFPVPFQSGSFVEPFFFHQAQHQQQEPRGAPPASQRAIRQLPTITVAPEDLVEESNRECCICLEENNLKDRVTRLPCAHIFHPHCVHDWLKKHCTCPVCRYEVPTDDAQYEAGRLERMKFRKPRFARYELERMSSRELKSFCNHQLNIPTRGSMEKKHLIQLVVDSGKIDLIAAPEPIEYPLSLLKAMKVSDLKRTMEGAGVFFDPVDVVEKQDMIRIFINSGRLVLEEEPQVEEEDNGYQEEEEKKPAAKKRKQNAASRLKNKRSGPILVETVEESEDERETAIHNSRRELSQRQSSSSSSAFMDYNEDFVEPPRQTLSERVVSTDEQGNEEEEEKDDGNIQLDETNSNNNDEMEVEPGENSEEQGITPPPLEESSDAFDGDSQRENHDEATSVPPPFQDRSITELREMARQLRIDLSDCIERSEMVERLTIASFVEAGDFDSWSTVALRRTAQRLGIESTNSSRPWLVDQLTRASETDPFIAHHLAVLVGLNNKSVSQLRRVARAWNVNVSDCLEKSEMKHRLLMAGGPP